MNIPYANARLRNAGATTQVVQHPLRTSLSAVWPGQPFPKAGFPEDDTELAHDVYGIFRGGSRDEKEEEKEEEEKSPRDVSYLRHFLAS